MKRKLRIGILALAISLLIASGIPKSFAVAGTTGTFEWRGNDTVLVGQELTMTIWGTGITGSEIVSVGGELSSSDNTCLSYSGPKKFAWSDLDGTRNDIQLTTVKFTAGSTPCTTTINITKPKLAFADDTGLSPATISKTITVRAPGNDATLKTLTPNAGTLSPAFSSGNTNYTISGIPATTGSIRFTTAVNDPKAKVISGGTCNLSSKTTTCNIVVQAEDGTKKTYSVVVTKDDPIIVKSNDATLKSLSSPGNTLSPNFASNTTNYTMKVGPNTSSVNFNATPNHEKASVLSGTTCNLTDKTTTCNIEVQAEDGTKKTYSVAVTKDDPAPEKSSDATLKSLSSKGNVLTPTFDPNTTNYTMEAASNATKVTFDAITNHDKASIVSGSTCDLTDKTTTCSIIVKAEDGSEKTYEVVVTKRDPQPEEPAKNNDATLKSLDVSGFTLIPTFNKDTTSYNISVNNNITGLNITAVPNDDKAKVTISGNKGWKEGINTVRITVTAEDGSEKVYIVNVNRKAANNAPAPSKSSNNYLENIYVNDGELKPNFDKNNSNYNIKVPNDVEELDLKIFAEDTKSTINIIGNDNFKIGMNVVTVEVTAEDGSVRVYTLNVDRDEKVNQNKLKDLIITNGEISPRFDSNKFEYEVNVSNKVNKLDITALPEFANSTVEIIGNDNLREGNNAILIKVTDENGFVQYYRLNVTKSGKSGFLGLTLGQWLLLLGSLLLIGLLIFILILLLKKRKEEEEKPKIPVVDANVTSPSSPVIEFKPEFNFGSKNGTDDDVVQPGGVLNQYTGYPESELKEKFNEDKKSATEADFEEIPYDPYDANVTKDEIFDAINEAIETKDSKKLKILYEQERLNREKEALKKAEEAKKSRSNRYHE